MEIRSVGRVHKMILNFGKNNKSQYFSYEIAGRIMESSIGHDWGS